MTNEIDPEYAAACPRCGVEQEDLDGFGVLYCPACGYCTHVCQSPYSDGWLCDSCGKVMPTTTQGTTS